MNECCVYKPQQTNAAYSTFELFNIVKQKCTLMSVNGKRSVRNNASALCGPIETTEKTVHALLLMNDHAA